MRRIKLKYMIMVLIPGVALICAMPRILEFVDDHFSEGNRRRTVQIQVKTIDALTKGAIPASTCKLAYFDTPSNDFPMNLRVTSDVNGIINIEVAYSTYQYRRNSRPHGWVFFDNWKCTVSAAGYEDTHFDFPKYRSIDRSFPPSILRPVLVELHPKPR